MMEGIRPGGKDNGCDSVCRTWMNSRTGVFGAEYVCGWDNDL